MADNVGKKNHTNDHTKVQTRALQQHARIKYTTIYLRKIKQIPDQQTNMHTLSTEVNIHECIYQYYN